MNDILVDDSGEVLVDNGDLVIGYSHQQHQRHLLLFEKGSLKQYPTVGVGAARYIESEEQAEFLKEIHMQFTGDGLKVSKLTLEPSGKLNILADYK